MRSFLKSNRDTFVNLSTGSGKSQCYCGLPLVFDKLRITPGCSIALVLKELMKDQVSKRRVRAVYIGDLDDDGQSLLTDLNWRDMLQEPVYQENIVAFVVLQELYRPLRRSGCCRNHRYYRLHNWDWKQLT